MDAIKLESVIEACDELIEEIEKTCLGCCHCHVTKDLEFWLEPEDQHRPDTPSGRCFVNIDLFWCDRPEDTDSTFAVLSYGTPSKFQKEVWFPQLAKVCNNFSPKRS